VGFWESTIAARTSAEAGCSNRSNEEIVAGRWGRDDVMRSHPSVWLTSASSNNQPKARSGMAKLS
jgi:hypothetical protein